MRLKVYRGLSLSGGAVCAEATGAPASSSPATMHSAMRIMQSFLVWSSIDDRSCACMKWNPTPQRMLPPPMRACPKSAHGAPVFLSAPGCLFGSFSTGCCVGAILDSYKPNQYGPPDFWGRHCRDLAKTDAGVESMADDAREKRDREQPLENEAALFARFKRPGEQLGHVRPNRPSERGTHEARAADPLARARGFG